MTETYCPAVRKKNAIEAMTSRERLLAALTSRPVDYVPCSIGFNELTSPQRIDYSWQFPWGPSYEEQLKYCVEKLQIDPIVNIRMDDFYPSEDVSCRTWMENAIIHKIWDTPSGRLSAAVNYNKLWPHGLDIPLYSDFNVGHFVEPWLKNEADLKCLRHLLLPPRTKEQMGKLRFHYNEMQNYADLYDLPTMVRVGLGLTGAQHLFGVESLCMKTIDSPALVDEYLELEHRMNLGKIEVAADLGIDIVHRNGFYETADLYSPQTIQSLLKNKHSKEIQTAHEAGMIIGYTVHTGVMPILDYLAELAFDYIAHIDIAFNGVDMEIVKDKLSKSKSMWIGPSNTFHMWAEDTEIVRGAVRDVFDLFGNSGFVLTSCPSVHSIMPWRNTLALIDEWKKLR